MPPVLRQSGVLSLHVMWDAGNVRRMRMSAEEIKAVLRRLFDEFYNMGNILIRAGRSAACLTSWFR